MMSLFEKHVHLVIDVESMGLYGEPFAVGWVLVDSKGSELDCGYLGYPDGYAVGSLRDREWVEQYVVPTLPECNTSSFTELCKKFGHKLNQYQQDYLFLAVWADCMFPVETNFFAALNGMEVYCDNPYPIHEIATVLFLTGKNPLEYFPRLENELPAHNPLNDARQSARLLIEALNEIK